VVIAIIAVLVGLLLPAWQRVREARTASNARTTSSRSPGASQLHDYSGRFPPGYQTRVAADNSDLGPGWGWAAFLLDDLEQGNLKKQIRFDWTFAIHSMRRTRERPADLCVPLGHHPNTFTVVDANAIRWSTSPGRIMWP